MSMTRNIVVLGCLAAVGLAVPALAQSLEDLQTRTQRLERDMRDVELELYRRKNADKNPAELGIVTSDQIGPITQRVGDMQESLTRLTGQLEELAHSVDELNAKLDRMQKDMEFRFSNLNTQPATEAAAPAETPPLASASGSLGTLPAAPPRPVERPSLRGADPKAEYDAAMDQLARAQYGAAQESFRAFAEAHPDDTLAPQALYWFGDIAYSTQKNYADAARAFAELLKKYAKAPRAPDAMVRLGESLINLGQKKEGCATLAALDAKYPNAAAAVSTRARTQRKAAKCA